MEGMDWAEIKRRLKEGTSVQILADLNGVAYKTMYNRIMQHQIKDGEVYLTPKNTKGLKKARAISKTKQAQAKAKEKAAGLPEVVPIKVEAAPELPEIKAGLCPEVVEKIKQQAVICINMSQRYAQQAKDWLRVLKDYGVDISGNIPEGDI